MPKTSNHTQDLHSLKQPYGRWIGYIILLSILLVITICISSALGTVRIPVDKAATILFQKVIHPFAVISDSNTDATILLNIRIPRILLAVLVGLSLASAGVVFQSLLRNPLADPFVIGVSSGSAVGAMIAMGMNLNQTILGSLAIPAFSFAGGLLTVFLVLGIAQNRGKIYAQSLLLAGVIVNAFFSAIIMFISTVFDPNHVQSYILWMIGHLEVTQYRLLLSCSIYVAIGWVILMAHARSLNLLSLGDETAMHLGVHVNKTKIILFIAAALISSAIVSISGIIGFIGLIIPHIMRTFVGSDHRILLPCSALGGAIFLVFADTLARVALAPAELPVGVITALFGAPFFIYLLRTKSWKHF